MLLFVKVVLYDFRLLFFDLNLGNLDNPSKKRLYESSKSTKAFCNAHLSTSLSQTSSFFSCVNSFEHILLVKVPFDSLYTDIRLPKK